MFVANNVPQGGAPAGPTDPYFANVVSLLHFDTGNTTITDVKGHSWTAVGDASANGVAKYGTNALALDGAGDGVKTSTAIADFYLGSGDFTAECWMYKTNTTLSYLFGEDITSTWGIVINNARFLFYTVGAARITGVAGAVPLNQWVHIAVCRQGTSWRAFQDGVQISTTYTSSETLVDGGIPFGVGFRQSDSGLGISGRIDDFRLTKGVARYTTNFTPPTAAFPDA
jgi:hypothetical protein